MSLLGHCALFGIPHYEEEGKKSIKKQKLLEGTIKSGNAEPPDARNYSEKFRQTFVSSCFSFTGSCIAKGDGAGDFLSFPLAPFSKHFMILVKVLQICRPSVLW